jgi:hypothetical protein
VDDEKILDETLETRLCKLGAVHWEGETARLEDAPEGF